METATIEQIKRADRILIGTLKVMNIGDEEIEIDTLIYGEDEYNNKNMGLKVLMEVSEFIVDGLPSCYEGPDDAMFDMASGFPWDMKGGKEARMAAIEHEYFWPIVDAFNEKFDYDVAKYLFGATS